MDLERDDDAEPGSKVTATTALAPTSHPHYVCQAIEEFQSAVSAVKTLLLREIEVAKAALLARLAELPLADLESLWDEGEQPQYVVIPYDE